MSKRFLALLFFLVSISLVCFFFLKKEKVNSDNSEEYIRTAYSKLSELGYVDGSQKASSEDMLKMVLEAIEWVPNGDISAMDVVKGRSFYNGSRTKQVGNMSVDSFSFSGGASSSDVLEGKTFYSSSGTLLTGSLRLPIVRSLIYYGTATEENVLSGKTFYSDSGILKTGTYSCPVYIEASYLGDALESEVFSGKKFYSNTGNLLTGSYVPVNFSNFQYNEHDDLAGGDYTGWNIPISEEDYQGEEAEWSYVSDDIWRDERTGLYWSSDQYYPMGIAGVPSSNSFTYSSCDFFSSSPRGSYDGSDEDCGNAINWCADLVLGGRSNWYLPTQKELMMAYIDGMYNQAGETWEDAASFTLGLPSSFLVHESGNWSSTEASDEPGNAWRIFLMTGYSIADGKSNASIGVRCVSRD